MSSTISIHRGFAPRHLGQEMSSRPAREQRVARWYFGGLASSGAACITHPIDLIKVHLQTHGRGRSSLAHTAMHVIQRDGFFALYNGISASILRQMTYSMMRFGMYDLLKKSLGTGTSPAATIGIAAVAGAAGGFIGTPGDMVNVRMQNDMKLSPELRRNYKHALDGLLIVARQEGVVQLFSGATAATLRAVFMTVGQLAFYDIVKTSLLSTGYFHDNTSLYFVSSFASGIMATSLTQPMDVIKTRMMNSRPGEFTGIGHVIRFTAAQGPLAFYKGYIPAFVRLGPHTILTFMFLEQLRLNFGYVREVAAFQ